MYVAHCGDPLQDSRLHAIRNLGACVPFDVEPDFGEIDRGPWRHNVSRGHLLGTF